MKDVLLSILGLLILFAPTALKVCRDRNGVKHPDRWGFILLCCHIIVSTGLLVAIRNFIGVHVYFNPVMESYLISAVIQVTTYYVTSAAIYASIFPYWINWVHLKNGVTEARVNIIVSNSPMFIRGVADYFECSKKDVLMHVLSHLSNSAWPDKTWWWRAIGWQGRLLVNVIILSAALYLYFVSK